MTAWPVPNPDHVARLLDSLQAEGVLDQAAVLLRPDPAAYVPR